MLTNVTYVIIIIIIIIVAKIKVTLSHKNVAGALYTSRCRTSRWSNVSYTAAAAAAAQWGLCSVVLKRRNNAAFHSRDDSNLMGRIWFSDSLEGASFCWTALETRHRCNNSVTYHSKKLESIDNGYDDTENGQQKQQTAGDDDKETSSDNHIGAQHSTDKVNLCDMQIDKHSHDGCTKQLK